MTVPKGLGRSVYADSFGFVAELNKYSLKEKELRQGGIEPPAQLILLAKLYFTTKPLALAGRHLQNCAYIILIAA